MTPKSQTPKIPLAARNAPPATNAQPATTVTKMIFRPLHLPEQAAKLARRLDLSKAATKKLVKFALTIEHSGGLAVGLEFISRATFHFPPSVLAWVVVGFGLLIWHTVDAE